MLLDASPVKLKAPNAVFLIETFLKQRNSMLDYKHSTLINTNIQNTNIQNTNIQKLINTKLNVLNKNLILLAYDSFTLVFLKSRKHSQPPQ